MHFLTLGATLHPLKKLLNQVTAGRQSLTNGPTVYYIDEFTCVFKQKTIARKVIESLHFFFFFPISEQNLFLFKGTILSYFSLQF